MREGLIAVQVVIVETTDVFSYQNTLSLTTKYRRHDNAYVHRDFLIHLANMLHFYLLFMFTKIYNYIFKNIKFVIYKIKYIKHIFSYNKYNKIGLMNLLIQKYL